VIVSSALFFLLLTIGTTLTEAQGAITRWGAFVYTGNTPYGPPSNTLVNGYAINTTAGTLTKVAGSPFATGGQVLAIASHPSGRFAYVASGNGTVAAFTVDSLDGSLTPVSGSPYTVGTSLGSGTVLAIDPAGKFLYVAGGSSLYAFAIDSTAGGLSAAAGSPYSFSAYSVTVDPSGKYLVAFGGSGSSSYSINGATGALTAAGSAVTGCGSSSMAFEPSGHFLYGTSNGISACSFDSSSGALVLVAGSPLVSPAAGGFSGVAVHPSGAFLYASDLNCNDNGPSNWLYGYLIDPATGGLTAIDGSPFALPGGSGCYYDEAVATEASGNFVYTVDANYGTAAYTVNQTTGALTLASNSFSGPGAFTVTTVPNATSSAATVTGLQIAPSSAQIHTSTLGKQYQFTLAATFSDGSTGFLTNSATWSSSSPSVATVIAGLATSMGYGTTTITATVGGQLTTASLTVAEPPLSSITVAPSTVTVYQGTAIQLTATGQYADGSSVDVTNTVTWNSSNTSAATVSAGGLVQSVGLGTATISATMQSITGASLLTVVPPFAWQTPAPITYGTPLSAAQLDASSGVTGTFVYTPPAGTVLPAGTQPLSVVFTPDGTTSANGQVTRTTSKALSQPRSMSSTPADTTPPSLAAAAMVSLTVNKAVLTVTANNQSMSYGAAVPTLTGTLNGLVAGDGITASYSTTGTSTSVPGSYPITATLNDPNSKLSNYTVTNTAGSLTIGNATATVTLGSLSKTYTGSPLAPTATTIPANLLVTLAYTQNGQAVVSPTKAGSYGVVATINDVDYSGTATGTLTINQATPTITWATPAAITYGTALSAAQLDASSTVAGTFAYTPTSGTVLGAGSQTLSVTFTPTDTTDYTTATATVTLTVNSAANPAQSIASLSPAFTDAGSAAFTLTINGTGFTSNSTAYWGTTALTTIYVSSIQLTASVTAAEIANAGTTSVTVQTATPGGGTSNSWQFEVNSASGSTTEPTFSSVTQTVIAGSPASYPVTLPSTVESASVTCLNLPTGATCSYSATTNTVTITTTAATPAGTYSVTVVFTETVSGAATAGILLPILLLPLLFLRRRLAARGIWLTACLGVVLLAGAAFCNGCGGGGSSSTTSPQTHQVVSAGTVTLTIH
jgi:6-phosphogluconolactonase (cycloisomerase 2 family)